jgi:3-deoxy-D-manno-octulosonate 8-phosphate phosphatase (KDO 8-P phosphatase)
MEESQRKIVFVLDVDGTLTNGKMYYTKEGKVMKAFGCDDFDALKTLSEKVEIQFISGDAKGFEISKKRADEMGIPIALVPSNAERRWKWIKTVFPDEIIVFMGDGINDYLALKNADYSFTLEDALGHTKAAATHGWIPRTGGERAVAQACIIIDSILGLGCFPEEFIKWNSR